MIFLVKSMTPGLMSASRGNDFISLRQLEMLLDANGLFPMLRTYQGIGIYVHSRDRRLEIVMFRFLVTHFVDTHFASAV